MFVRFLTFALGIRRCGPTQGAVSRAWQSCNKQRATFADGRAFALKPAKGPSWAYGQDGGSLLDVYQRPESFFFLPFFLESCVVGHCRLLGFIGLHGCWKFQRVVDWIEAWSLEAKEAKKSGRALRFCALVLTSCFVAAHFAARASAGCWARTRPRTHCDRLAAATKPLAAAGH